MDFKQSKQAEQVDLAARSRCLEMLSSPVQRFIESIWWEQYHTEFVRKIGYDVWDDHKSEVLREAMDLRRTSSVGEWAEKITESDVAVWSDARNRKLARERANTAEVVSAFNDGDLNAAESQYGSLKTIGEQLGSGKNDLDVLQKQARELLQKNYDASDELGDVEF